MEARISREANKPAKRAANAYVHIAKPATASQILRDLGISQARVKRFLQTPKFASVKC